MKSIKLIALVVFGLLLGISSMDAQQNQNRGKNMNRAAVETMTAQQKQLIQEQRDRIKEKRELFRASLTEAQLAIFDNNDLNEINGIYLCDSCLETHKSESNINK